MRNSILMADKVAHGDLRDEIWEVFAKRGMGFFAGTIDGDDPAPVEDFQMPPAKGSDKGRIRGFVTDADTNNPIKDAVVYIGGHFSGFPTDYGDETNRRGRYVIRKVFVGTFPKLVAKAPGYDTVVVPITVHTGLNLKNFELKRDWAAASGGASIEAFNGPDYTQFGCGPANVIDQSLGAGWGSDTDENAASTGKVIPKFVVIKLPEAVDVSEIKIDPSNTCGDPGSSSTRGFRVETSTDGTTFSQVSEGVFYAGNRGKLNTVSTAGDLTGVTHVKFWMLNPQVPTDPNPNAACTGPADCGTDPDDVSGVAAHCGPGKDNGFQGCTFMDSVEVVVYGRSAE
jgi:extracellular elastinolytic metalloproteinase